MPCLMPFDAFFADRPEVAGFNLLINHACLDCLVHDDAPLAFAQVLI